MAAIHGKNSGYKIDNALGTIVDITQYLDNVEQSRDTDQLDATTLGDQDKDYLPGFQAGQYTLSGKYDEAVGAIYDILATGVGSATTRTFQYGPDGTATGKTRYTGEAVILSFEVSMTVDDIVTFSSTIRIDGAVTRDTF